MGGKGIRWIPMRIWAGWLTLLFSLIPTVGLAFSDISYDISCKFNPDRNRFSCEERVSFRPGQSLNEIHFHFYPNHRWSKKEIEAYKRYAEYFSVEDPFLGQFDPNWAEIKEAYVNSKPVPWEFRGEDKTVLVLRSGKIISEKVQVRLRFEFYVPRRIGRFGRFNGIYSLYRFYPILDVYREGRFLDYPDLALHQPYISESAIYRVEFTVPSDVTLAASLPGKKERVDFNWSRWRFEGDYSLRDFYLAMSSKFRLYRDSWQGKDVLVCYLGNRERSAQEIAGFVKDGLAFFSKAIAEYPYPQISVIPVGLGYGGNESSGAILLDWRVYDLPFILKRYKEFLVVHELGHQWWYSQVGSDEYKETWMDEGINSYWVHRYLEHKYGPNPEVLILPGPLKYIFPNFTFRDSGIYKWRYLTLRGRKISVLGEIGKFKEPSLIFALAYGKGERILEMLEKRFGRDRIDAFFRRYFNEYKGKIATLKDFEQLLKKDVGPEAVEMLEFYLSPKVVNLFWEKKGPQVCLSAKGYEEAIGPVEINLRYRDGEVRSVSLDRPEYCFASRQVIEAKIDPEDKILEDREDDNTYPAWKRVEGKFNIVNHFLYDLPVVNQNATLRSGFYANKYGVGVRLSYTNPSTETNLWFAPLWGIDEGSRSYCLGVRYPSLGRSFWSAGLDYVYEDIYERDILHRKISLYLSYPLAPPSNNPFGPKEELRLYVGHEYRQRPNLGVYYPESDLAYLGVSVSKRFYDWWINIGAEKGVHWLDGDVDFVRGWIYGDWRDNIAGSIELGVRAGVGISDEDSVEMFYLGGADGMRAFSRYDLPGKGRVYLGAEVIAPLWNRDVEDKRFGWVDVERVSGVGFVDLGQIWQDDYSSADTEEFSDAGAGFEFLVSAGSNLSIFRVRVLWAKSLRGEKKDRVSISVGTTF